MLCNYVDAALYYTQSENVTLRGLTGNYVEDALHSEDGVFLKQSDKILEKFEYSYRQMDKMKFSVFYSDRIGILMHQWSDTYKIQALPITDTFAEFRSARSRLTWIVHTRPEIMCSVAFATQETESSFVVKSMKLHNRVVLHLRKTKYLKIAFPRLSANEFHIKDFPDSPFANNGLYYQLGQIILVCEKL